MYSNSLVWLLALPAAGGLVCRGLKSRRAILAFVTGGMAVIAVLAFRAAGRVFCARAFGSAGQWLALDALSAFHLVLMMTVYLLCSIFAWIYFAEEIRKGRCDLRLARKFGSLWFWALTSMMLVLLSNNIGILWVGIEASTLMTAFLICIHITPASLEATWKYLVVCSVGVAFAFMGTLLVGAAAAKVAPESANLLNWTHLTDIAPGLSPALMKLAFLFLLVGYGTKVGLAPMHSWLPDAHSQAPAPVSALFSGFLLNTALYCVMRFIPLVQAATGHSGWALGILVIFGAFSILLASAFITGQRDIKRLLAYSSVEHLGIITLGLGLGGIGTFAALFHTMNHSLCKPLAFFSAGRLGQMRGSHEIQKLAGSFQSSAPWALALVASLFALGGMVPSPIFFSEFMVGFAAIDRHRTGILVLLLAGLAIVFLGLSRCAIAIAWGRPESGAEKIRSHRIEGLFVAAVLAMILVLGFWMPTPLKEWITAAAAIIGGAP